MDQFMKNAKVCQKAHTRPFHVQGSIRVEQSFRFTFGDRTETTICVLPIRFEDPDHDNIECSNLGIEQRNEYLV